MHSQSVMPTIEAEQHIIAAMQHILKAFGSNKNLSDDFRCVIKEFDSHLSSMSVISESEGSELSQIEERLKCAEKKVELWKSNPSSIWDAGPMETAEYLQAVNEILAVTESLGGVPIRENSKAREITLRAQHVQQIAMSRLEQELCHILVQHKQCFKMPYVPFHSPAEKVVYDQLFSSIEDEELEETSQRRSKDGESLEYTLDLVDPRVICDIKSIADIMSAGHHSQEFCEAFISVRRDALFEYLSFLEMERRSIEDVLKLEWDCLDSEIKKWVSAMKIIIRGYLTSEKQLCDHIMGDFTADNSYCFVEISKDSIFCLVNFGQAVAMGPHKPEKLFRLLGMYDVLAKMHLEIDGLFSEDNGSFIRIEFHELLSRLGDSARETFLQFGDAISSDASVHPFPGGGVHHLTKYVMNYMRLFPDHADTINLLLKDQEIDESNIVEIYEGHDLSSTTYCPMACHLRSFASALESNLISKMKLYKDESLQHVFLINNIHYMVQKVKSSELRPFFGDEWIRKHTGKFRQHATAYVRTTWSSIVSILREDGKLSSKERIERCRRFSTAFEEVYRSQTQWHIGDTSLREDLQISTSQKVIPAYRNFLGVNNSNISDKYVKYTADELENLLLDFFIGSPRSLRNSRRR